MSWRKDSVLSDGSDAHVDLEGGYYDAGDNVKFGFPMAFTTTMLSWSVLEFGGLMKSELQNAKEAVRWATNYLLKATAQPDTIYVQVGIHKRIMHVGKGQRTWTHQEKYIKVDKNNPGTEISAETAAASMVFRRSDHAYSRTLLNRATRVFEFADKYRGSYSDGLKDVVCPFYCSYSGYQDELLWGATWLHRATRNTMYLNYIQRNGQVLSASEEDYTFGWDNKHVGARILLSKSLSDGGNDVDDVADDVEADGSDDDFYISIKRQRDLKLRMKAEKSSGNPQDVSEVDTTVDGKRNISSPVSRSSVLSKKKKKTVESSQRINLFVKTIRSYHIILSSFFSTCLYIDQLDRILKTAYMMAIICKDDVYWPCFGKTL